MQIPINMTTFQNQDHFHEEQSKTLNHSQGSCWSDIESIIYQQVLAFLHLIMLIINGWELCP